MAISTVTRKAIEDLKGIWGAVDAARSDFAPKPAPENGFTCSQYAKQYELKPDVAKYQLRRMTSAGLLEVHRCYIANNAGKMVIGSVYTVTAASK